MLKQLRGKPVRIIGLTLIALGLLGVSLSSEHLSNQPRTIAAKAVTTTLPPPTAKEVSEYTVPPSYPKFISIPEIGIGTTMVRPLGLVKDGVLATPDSIYETGWYEASSKPGQQGAMFIYGHIASWTKYSVFAKLLQLKPGDDISVTRGDNTVFRYKVIGSQVYPYNAVDMTRVLSAIKPGTPGLNLMTCAGNIITVSGMKEYSQRLVVFTKQI